MAGDTNPPLTPPKRGIGEQEELREESFSIIFN